MITHFSITACEDCKQHRLCARIVERGELGTRFRFVCVLHIFDHMPLRIASFKERCAITDSFTAYAHKYPTAAFAEDHARFLNAAWFDRVVPSGSASPDECNGPPVLSSSQQLTASEPILLERSLWTPPDGECPTHMTTISLLHHGWVILLIAPIQEAALTEVFTDRLVPVVLRLEQQRAAWLAADWQEEVRYV